jgi:hypothetical protein
MKKYIIIMLFSLNTFAQGNSNLDNWENGNNYHAGGNENGNSPSAPIDTYIIILICLGTIYGIKKIYNKNIRL